MKTTSKMNLKYEDNLKKEDDLKNEDNLINQDNLKNEGDLRNEDDYFQICRVKFFFKTCTDFRATSTEIRANIRISVELLQKIELPLVFEFWLDWS